MRDESLRGGGCAGKEDRHRGYLPPHAGHYEYRIKWKGYPLSKCTWEPEANLKFVQPLLNSYNATHPLPPRPNAHALPPPPPSPQPEHSSDQSPSSLEEEEPAGTVKEGAGRKGIQKKRGRKPKGQAGRAKKEDGRSAAKPTPPQSELKRPRGRPRKTPLPPSQELVFPAEESEEAEMPSELGYEVSG